MRERWEADFKIFQSCRRLHSPARRSIKTSRGFGRRGNFIFLLHVVELYFFLMENKCFQHAADFNYSEGFSLSRSWWKKKKKCSPEGCGFNHHYFPCLSHLSSPPLICAAASADKSQRITGTEGSAEGGILSFERLGSGPLGVSLSWRQKLMQTQIICWWQPK